MSDSAVGIDTGLSLAVAPSYTLPAEFLAHCVRNLAELDKAHLKLKVDGHEIISSKLPSPGVSEQRPETNEALVQAAETTKPENTGPKGGTNATGGNENPAIAAPPAGSTEEPGYSMSLDEYLDIRDEAACAFLTDANGKIGLDPPSLLLQAKSHGTVDYAQCLVEHLARDIRCDLLSFDLDDLDDLGLAFHDQDKRKDEEETMKQGIATEIDIRVASELEAMESSGIADDVPEKSEDGTRPSTESDPTEAPQEGQGGSATSSCSPDSPSVLLAGERKETPDRDEEYCMAKFYFGTAKPKGRHDTEEQRERNKMALDAVFNASSFSSSASSQDTRLPTDESPPLIIFVRDAVRILELSRGHRLLARLRDRIIERRQSNMPTWAIFLCIGSSSCSCCAPSWKGKAMKKSGAFECLALPVNKTATDQLKKREAMFTGRLNVRLLKQALKVRHPQLVSEELVGRDVVWDCKGLENEGSFLSSKILDKDALRTLVRVIRARAWGKPAIPLEDVVAVLNRKESSRDHGRGEDMSKDDLKADARLNNLSSHEETLSKYVIKPGQSA